MMEIQSQGRNRYDVIMELVKLHIDTFGVNEPEEIEELYLKYYYTVYQEQRLSVEQYTG